MRYWGLLFLTHFLGVPCSTCPPLRDVAHNGQFSRGANLVCALGRRDRISLCRARGVGPDRWSLNGLGWSSSFARWRLRVCFSATSVSRSSSHSPTFLPLSSPSSSPFSPPLTTGAPTSTASAGDILFTPTFFGKLVKRAFPGIKGMRKGPRGRATQVRPPIPLDIFASLVATALRDLLGSHAVYNCRQLASSDGLYCFSFCLSTTCTTLRLGRIFSSPVAMASLPP